MANVALERSNSKGTEHPPDDVSLLLSVVVAIVAMGEKKSVISQGEEGDPLEGVRTPSLGDGGVLAHSGCVLHSLRFAARRSRIDDAV
mmetsp:Transcript_27986/g.32394  ORF Transcript_27986/g.32394 Transcript_27986/m.32394 type:complete len:88 (-) Transcript_27986:892-1155(-)